MGAQVPGAPATGLSRWGEVSRLGPGIQIFLTGFSGSRGYSNFGIAADRNHTLKWLFPQEKATFQCTQKDRVNSEIALA